MSDRSLHEREWLTAPMPMPYDPYHFGEYDPFYRKKGLPPLSQQQKPTTQRLPPQAQTYRPLLPTEPPHLMPQHLSPTTMPLHHQYTAPVPYMPNFPKVDSPRELRNKAEKQRRDRMNQSIAELASIVPPVVNSTRKIDKIGVLRYTAHYLRANQYVFDPAPEESMFSQSSMQALLGLLNGFMLTTTYKGLIVVASQNINDYLGYTELELLGKSVFSIIHKDDRHIFKEKIMPKPDMLGHNGELLLPEGPDGREKVSQALAKEKRCFVVRFIKHGQRSEPIKYVACHIEGSLRMSDHACRGYTRCCQMGRRARARTENPCSSGNDVVFIGVVRPSTETFINESALEAYRMEYRTRHSVDGEIIQCEQRISLVTGYMASEVRGVNAMNFIHRDEMRWVVIALKDMYDNNHMYGESCYRLMTKNGQFIYMRTRGRLDIEEGSGAVTTFACTNTEVTEEEGKHLIKLMKEKHTLPHEEPLVDYNRDSNDSEDVEVEDPKQLEKVILSLVGGLPSPQALMDSSKTKTTTRGDSPTHRLAIIPPKKERILSAIEKIHTVFNTTPRQNSDDHHIDFDGQHAGEAAQKPMQRFYEFPGLHTFDEHYQIQNASGMEINSITPTISSDVDLLTSLDMTNSYNEMSALDFLDTTNGLRLKPETGYQSPALGPDEGQKTTVYGKRLMLEPSRPGPSTNAGVKRANRSDDQEITTKKKIANYADGQSTAIVEVQSSSNPEVLTLESFFDESSLHNQIQSAIDSLKDENELNFHDLLTPTDIENILETIGGEPEEE